MIRKLELRGTIAENIEKIKSILAKQIKEDLDTPNRFYLIRKTALRVAKDCKPYAYLCECKKLHEWVTNNFRYVRDPYGIELFISPYMLLKRRFKNPELAQADCESLSQLYCALAISIGHKCYLVLLDTTGDGNVNHCVVLVKPKKYGWYWADPAKDSLKPEKIGLTKRLPYPIYKKEIIKIEVG